MPRTYGRSARKVFRAAGRPFRKSRRGGGGGGVATSSSASTRPSSGSGDALGAASQRTRPSADDDDAATARASDDDDDDDAPRFVAAERRLRSLAVALASFRWGAERGANDADGWWRTTSGRALEYAVVAWATCAAMAWWARRDAARKVALRRRRGGAGSTPNRRRCASTSSWQTVASVDEPLTTPVDENGTAPSPRRHDDDDPNDDDQQRPPDVVTTEIAHKNDYDGRGNHPDLEQLSLILTLRNGVLQRVTPNRLLPFETEYAVGTMMLMVRTPDVDEDAVVASMDARARAAAEHFHGKQRRFEFQFQFRLKERPPPGEVYMGVEFDDPLKMGMVQRAVAMAGLAFVRKTNPGFHYSLTGGDDKHNVVPRPAARARGEYQRAHMAFPVLSCMDRFVVAAPGEAAPTLGTDVVESAASIRQRKRGWTDFPGWTTEHVYTMCVWSAYADFLKWRCVNLPGVRPFSISSLSGAQAINMTIYSLRDAPSTGNGDTEEHNNTNTNNTNRPHMQRDKSYLASLELSLTGKVIGKKRAEWERSTRRRSEEEVELAARDSFASDDDDDDAGEEEDDDDSVVEELGGGMYLRYGDPVFLRGVDDGFVTNASGFAVLQDRSPRRIVLEPADGRPRRRRKGSDDRTSSSSSSSGRLIRSGDAVVLKLLSPDEDDVVSDDVDDREDVGGGSERRRRGRYLSTHRGVWLKWTRHSSQRNAQFTVHTNECEGTATTGDAVMVVAVAADEGASSRSIVETQSTYLPAGGTFALRHRRWSRYEVGVGMQRSSRFGGRLLGIRKREYDDVALVDPKKRSFDL